MAKASKTSTAKISLLRRGGNAIKFATGSAETVGKWGADSVTGARKAVQARPLTTALVSVGAGALFGAIIAFFGFGKNRSRRS